MFSRIHAERMGVVEAHLYVASIGTRLASTSYYMSKFQGKTHVMAQIARPSPVATGSANGGSVP